MHALRQRGLIGNTMYYLKSIEGVRLLIRGSALMIIWHGIPACHADSLDLIWVKNLLKFPNKLVALWMRYVRHYLITYDYLHYIVCLLNY